MYVAKAGITSRTIDCQVEKLYSNLLDPNPHKK